MSKQKKWDIGIALDGDADRLGAAGSKGRFINSQEVYILLLYHLIKNKNMKGDIVKAFNMTAMINPIAEENNIKIHETKIGFKYIADEILSKDILLGGEESGGYAVKGHLPERDGIFNGLMLMELVAYENMPPEKILDKLYKKYGYYYYGRYDLYIQDNEKKEAIANKLFLNPPEKILRKPVVKKENLDGLKLFFNDGGWILFRVSGTEPLIRIYVESRQKKGLNILLNEGKNLLLKI
jgi:phosphomannomutase